ncbi:MAG: FHA domain-containing protein [Verrucomicrobia bacterium]|nr:FHA domain-containing protein [Verrucomicrobiota bacterium]
MLKLVVLSPGMTGHTHELTLDKTTVGRLEDNAFTIADPSVSSHHCEVLLRGNEVLVRDLNSTNGTYISGGKISESVLKPGQIVRLGQMELRLETDEPAAPGKKHFDRTTVIAGGIKLTELERGARGGGFDTKGSGFSKKDNTVNKVFISIGVVLGLVIVALLIYMATTIKK